MANLIKLVYVGNKPAAYDNIARSGKTWNGKSDVQEVTDAQAKLLLKFPDQWQLVDAKDKAAIEAPVSISVTGEAGEDVIVDPETFKQPIEKLSKSELSAYALNKWGKDLSANKNRKDMIDQIEEWERDLDVIVGVPE
jgi:hypothetical protein